jgi:dihydroxyacid dehydratase/phosphogluconate dehydratase
MGAASTDLPTIVVTGGPMLNGWFRASVSARARISGNSPKP